MDWNSETEQNGQALLGAASVDLSAPVPACPGWDVAELLRHTGTRYRVVEIALREQRTAVPTVDEVSIPGRGSLEWYAGRLGDVLDVLRTTDPRAPTWTFGPDQTGAFWHRRIAHETIIHRVDAEQATGISSPITADVACDGIGEVLEVFVPLTSPRSTRQEQGLRLHATDMSAEWFVTFGDRAVSVGERRMPTGATVSGTAAALYLWIWGRASNDSVQAAGDPELVRLFRLLTSL